MSKNKKLLFYIGCSTGSGMEFNTKEEFLSRVSELIDICEENNGTEFDIDITSDVDLYKEQKR